MGSPSPPPWVDRSGPCAGCPRQRLTVHRSWVGALLASAGAGLGGSSVAHGPWPCSDEECWVPADSQLPGQQLGPPFPSKEPSELSREQSHLLLLHRQSRDPEGTALHGCSSSGRAGTRASGFQHLSGGLTRASEGHVLWGLTWLKCLHFSFVE